ncbi:MAG: polysaccharide deacetylase family protein, partial [FCB group bacterium]|nr:polysaccharide deacetylase family protein [FCB group bacterium]
MPRANPYFELSAMLPLSRKTCLLTIDVEDWYHILDLPSAPDMSAWDSRPARVERNFNRLLEILDQKNIKATCFFLGWIAQKFPHLVRKAQAAGHEIASHGFSHRLAYRMTETEFYDDAVRAKKVIEDITGAKVRGYRASGFSVTEQTPWFFEALMRAE